MSNHFHLLIEVPKKERAVEGWSDGEFLERLRLLHSEVNTRQVLAEIKMWKRNGNSRAVHKAAMAVQDRIFGLSKFVKEFKFQALGFGSTSSTDAKVRFGRNGSAVACWRLARQFASAPPTSILILYELERIFSPLVPAKEKNDPPFAIETRGPVRTPPVYTWWKPEASDPAQLELTTPQWSPDFESQE